jgi:ComF family protein
MAGWKFMADLKTIKEFILDFLFPKKCAGCQKEGLWLCDQCFEKIVFVKAPACPFCNRLTSKGQFCSRCRGKTFLTGVITSAHYEEGPLKEAIHHYKYNRIRDLVEKLAEIMVRRLEEGFPNGRLVLVPVPLHPKREAERGFNQARELAKKISEYFDITFVECLKRERYTLPQVEKTGAERRTNVINAFVLEKDISQIKDKTVLLVDDVFTTGATLSECARKLRQAGARQVWGLVLAKV